MCKCVSLKVPKMHVFMVKKQKQIFNSSDFGYKQPLGQVLVANISFILSCGPEKCFYLCFNFKPKSFYL